MQVVIPMAGLSSRFFNYGFKKIKYELPVDRKGTRMIDAAIQSLCVTQDSKFYFLIREDVKNLKGTIVKTDNVTQGSASSVNILYDYLDENKPLIVANCDQIMEYSYDNFIRECSKYDGCVMTYHDETMSPKNSFISFNPTRVTEKIPMKNSHPLTGIHYFKEARMFREGYDYMVKNDIKAPNGEFYVSLVYQALVELGYTIGMYKLSGNEKYHPIGEPIEYFKYIGDFEQFPVYDGFKFHSCVEYKDSNVYVEGTLINYEIAKDYTRGWVVGDFDPCLFRRTEYEVGILKHEKLVHHDYHVHYECDETNLLLSGNMNLNGIDINPGTIFIIPRGYISCAVFNEDCIIVCVKTPSKPKDKVCF